MELPVFLVIVFVGLMLLLRRGRMGGSGEDARTPGAEPDQGDGAYPIARAGRSWPGPVSGPGGITADTTRRVSGGANREDRD
jgi:hypothetical protein